MSKVHIFVIDNVDSFVFNLVDFLYSVTDTISVYRNTVDGDSVFESMQHSRASGNTVMVVLSPGPCRPSDVPLMDFLIKKCRGIFPILGICLGHQAIVESYGGKVGACEKIMHGKKDIMTLSTHAIFDTFGDTLSVARYHSLTALEVPSSLRILAKTNDAVMAVVDDANKVIGLQFHPESILTVQGEQLLHNICTYLTECT